MTTHAVWDRGQLTKSILTLLDRPSVMLLVEIRHQRDQTLLEGDLVDCIDLDQQHDGQVRYLAGATWMLVLRDYADGSSFFITITIITIILDRREYE